MPQELPRAPDKAIDLARAFMENHAETIQFEIEYAANGETTFDDQNRLVVHDTDGPAVDLLNFMKAMSHLAKTGEYDAEALKKGIGLIGSEIHATQEDVQVRHREAMRTTAPKRRERALKEKAELSTDVDKLMEVQGDILGVLKAIGINTRRSQGGGEMQR